MLTKSFERIHQQLDEIIRLAVQVEPVPKTGFVLSWPSPFHIITQVFGANPASYAVFNLPGHEGLDIRAPEGTVITACADGVVFQTSSQISLGLGHAYGNHVRLRHEVEGAVYHTIYAHLSVIYSAALVVGGQMVRGQKIGEAGNTGNSRGPHLHLTLKKEGSTAAGETAFPLDIIDPTPFLESA